MTSMISIFDRGTLMIVLFFLTFPAAIWAQDEQQVSDALRSGKRLVEIGRLDRAHKQFTRALELAPDNAQAHYGLGFVAFQQGRLKESRALLESALALNPKHFMARRTLGAVLARMHDVKGAVATLTKAVELDPTDIVSRKLRAGAFRELGRCEEARSDLQAALRIQPNYTDAFHGLGLLETRPARNQVESLRVDGRVSRPGPARSQVES